jgi:hypothetical protein
MGAGLLADVSGGAVNRAFTVLRAVGREEPGTAPGACDVLDGSDTRRRSPAPDVVKIHFGGRLRANGAKSRRS